MPNITISVTSLAFEALLVHADPDLYKRVDWFSSHAYPCAGDGSGGPHDGCGLGGDPRPNTNGWNAPFEVAKPWLLVYRNETRLVGRPDVSVIITETGWCGDFCTEEERAGWQVSAWEAWFADAQVMAACPFLLAGRQWWLVIALC